MPIAFNQIPAKIGVPGTYVEFDGSNARTSAGGKPYSALIFGQMSAAKTLANPTGSTVPANLPAQVTSAAQAAQYFGSGSVLAHMAKTFFATNPYTTVYFAPQLDNAAGVARVVTVGYAIAYAAPAVVAGVERLYIGEDEYATAVAIGDTGAAVATALAALITADTTALFTAAAAAGVLTLTAKAKGELLNDVQITAQYYDGETSPSGAFAPIAQTVAGLQNPDVTTSLAACSSLDFTHCVFPYNDDANALLITAEAQQRWAPLPNATSLGQGQNDFMIFGAFRGTEAEFTTFASDRNSQHMTVAHIEPQTAWGGVVYAGLMSSAWQYSAAYGAASISLVSVVANKPHQNYVLTALKAAPRVSRFPWVSRNRTIALGGSTYTYTPSDQVLLENGITTMTLTNTGVTSDAEQRVETQFANSFIRWSLRVTLETKFPAHRLADDGRGLPSDVATPLRVKAVLVSLASEWANLGIIENLPAFIKSVVVERSAVDCNRIEFEIRPDIVNVLVVKAGKNSYIVC